MISCFPAVSLVYLNPFVMHQTLITTTLILAGSIVICARESSTKWMDILLSPMLKRLQCMDTDWKRLSRLEDLAFLPADNPSALFSGIFCFVTRRQYYIDAVSVLQPSNSLDGSSTVIADCFPHAMLSLPRVAGKPIAYIGEPCLMQGISGWEWGAYAYKNMIFGTHQFFEWLEQTTFASDAMQHLWNSYYHMAGRLYFRMLHYREEHKGLDIVLKKAIPSSAGHVIFWDAFMEESHTCISTRIMMPRTC